MKFVSRREKNRKAFTSPNGLDFLANVAPTKQELRNVPGWDHKKIKPKSVRPLRDGSIVFGDNGNPYPYTTSASKEQGRW